MDKTENTETAPAPCNCMLKIADLIGYEPLGRLQLSKTDIQELIKIVEEVSNWTAGFAKVGFPYFENMLANSNDNFTRFCLENLLAGLTTEQIKEFGLRKIILAKSQGYHLIRRIIILGGILSLCCSNSSFLIKRRLMSWIPIE